MKIVNGFDLIKYAKSNCYILPAFNTTNLEMTNAIVQGLARANIPGFIQISSNNLRLSHPKVITYLTNKALEKVDVPIALHLDHGRSFEDVKACVDAGFTSIMIDASHLEYEDNIKLVRKCADYCHFYNIPLEAELGTIKGKEEDIAHGDTDKTNPALVFDFVSRANCDLLAVAVGNVHGLDLEPELDLPLLEKISQVCPVPLVLHGGSGIPKEAILAAKKFNLVKINIASELRRKFISVFGEAYQEDTNAHDLISLSIEAQEEVASLVEEKALGLNEKR
ncbi:class II aldolase [Propionispora vibrioides]|uniref:Ketose-bisphosphate aldolase n=1 Tax=Propionispora vibrioides TaxID=112903 RepID=A0A1H8SHC4_9FIRM|nr:class II aldolase [Propionispora vibrioides]SEO78071.1 ketose-bisphosphate aldolase [Propionispora vibrioides]